MAQRRNPNAGYGSSDQDNLFYPRGGAQPRGGAVPGGAANGPQPGGMPGTEGNPNTGVNGGAPPAPIQPPIVTNPLLSGDKPGAGTEPGPYTAVPPAVKQRTYANIPGLDTSKLQNESYSSYKYGNGARALSSFIGSGGKVGRNDMGGLIDWAKNEFGVDAKAVGDDKVDFGDGAGPVDILLGGSDGLWWGQEGPGGPAPAPSAHPFNRQPGPVNYNQADAPTGHTESPQNRMSTAAPGPDPFAASGGGQFFPNTGQWVPKNNPEALAAAKVANDAAGPSLPPVGTPGGGVTRVKPPDLGPLTANPDGTASHNPGINIPFDDGGQWSPEEQPGTAGHGDLDAILKHLMSGDLNQGIVDRRVDNARDTLTKQRKSATDTLGAQMAERGQLGDGGGADGSAAMRLDQGLNDDFAGTVSDIYSDEGAAADSRMMQALITSAGLSTADAQNLVDRFNAQTGRKNSDTQSREVNNNFDLGNRRLGWDEEFGRADIGLRGRAADATDTRNRNDFELGQGDLDVRRRSADQNFDLGNRRLASDDRLGNRGLDLQDAGQHLDWDKFAANYGMDRDKLQWDIEHGNMDDIIRILQIQSGNAGTSSGGHI